MSTVGTPKSPEQIQHDWNTNPRWKGIEPHLLRRRTSSPCRATSSRRARSPAAAPRCCGSSSTTWTTSTRLAR